MSDGMTLEVHARALKGRSGARATRREQQAPAIIYGADKPTELVSLDQNLLNRLVHKVAFHTQVLTLSLPSGKQEQVIVKEIQYHPIKPMVRHVDFCRVSKKKAMRLSIPIHCVGEEDCVAVREQGGVLMQSKHEIEVECLPVDLPSSVTLDISQLAMDQTYHVSDIKLPKGVVFVDPPHDDHDHPVVSVHAPKMKDEAPEEVVVDEASEAMHAADEAASDGEEA